MLRPLACVPRDGDSPTMLRPLACRPRYGWHPMPDSHPEITSIRSLVEAHSSVTPGQDAKRTQPGELGGQRKSASKRLTSIFDAHSQRGPCSQSLVCGAPGRRPSYVQQYNYIPCGRSNERPYCWMMVGCGVGAKVGARPAQGAATTTDVDLRVECDKDIRRLNGGWTLLCGHRDGTPPMPNNIITSLLPSGKTFASNKN